eukprot:NODE_3883_length_840_cov_83.228612_g3860_i0.p1 GENE.NODE_3883_length_840_cov_83.228612_g3860_i0~~NODE_3883_length_840_cov_83.228612_g3860_i0.p1  ORF type:complete len:217 (-),score=29.91 NODE_3883_length_840_cov_83.228612_g3860_i0:76-726(-)
MRYSRAERVEAARKAEEVLARHAAKSAPPPLYGEASALKAMGRQRRQMNTIIRELAGDNRSLDDITSEGTGLLLHGYDDPDVVEASTHSATGESTDPLSAMTQFTEAVSPMLSRCALRAAAHANTPLSSMRSTPSPVPEDPQLSREALLPLHFRVDYAELLQEQKNSLVASKAVFGAYKSRLDSLNASEKTSVTLLDRTAWLTTPARTKSFTGQHT